MLCNRQYLRRCVKEYFIEVENKSGVFAEGGADRHMPTCSFQYNETATRYFYSHENRSGHEWWGRLLGGGVAFKAAGPRGFRHHHEDLGRCAGGPGRGQGKRLLRSGRSRGYGSGEKGVRNDRRSLPRS